MPMFIAYADASGKNSGPLLCVAAVISDTRKWKQFEPQWRKRLAQDGVTEFHATDFASSKREYKDWKGDTARRGKFFNDLLRIIKNNISTAPLSATIELADWNAVNQDYCLAESFYSPYAISGYAVVGEALKWVQRKGEGANIQFIFEDGDEGRDGLIALCQKDGIKLTFWSKNKALPCQAADLIAWKSRTACKNAGDLNTQLDGTTEFDKGLAIFEKLFDEYDSVMRSMVSSVEPKVFSRRNLVTICERAGVARR